MSLSRNYHSDEEIIFLEKLGQRLSNARTTAKMSQPLVANRLNCSVNHVSDIETGNTSISLFEFLELCKIYDLDSGLFLSGGIGYDVIRNTERMTPKQLEAIRSLVIDFNLFLDETLKMKNNTPKKYF